MKQVLGYVGQAVMPVAVIAMVVIMAHLATGCGAVQVKPVQDPAIVNDVLQEAGSSFAYFGLKKQSDRTIGRISEVLRGAKESLLDRDVNLVSLVPQVTAELQQEVQLDDDYEFLLGRAVNLMSKLVQVDLTVPENYGAAMNGINAFLVGAEEGITALLSQRRRNAGV
jgi:hypothetical protein